MGSSPRTKLVCTIGPASRDRVDELIAAGMSVARVNLAHGDPADHDASITAVRAAADRVGRDVAVLVDLPGPKIRLGHLHEGEATLEVGRPFRLGPKEIGDATGATSSHPLAGDLRRGDRILLSDGAAELRVTGSTGDTVETIVERGGTVRSRAGVAVPAERLSLAALTSEDRAVLPHLVALGVDFVGLSFVRRASDVTSLREALAALTPHGGPAIVAKIETRPAVEDAEAVLRATDAVMVARGDLGVEFPFEDVPLIQKRLVRAARAAERPVIVATQMLESMTAAPRPTRAEVSDVANAVLDGADAVMLSAETAIGAFPTEAADAAIRIVAAADIGDATASPPSETVRNRPGDERAVALAAIELARNAPNIRALVCFSRSGGTARLLAGQRPPVPIVAFCPEARVRRQLALVHGVVPHPIGATSDQDVPRALSDAVAGLYASPDSAFIVVATTAGGTHGPNVVEVVHPAGR